MGDDLERARYIMRFPSHSWQWLWKKFIVESEGKVLIDFKSGRSMPSHLDDLRFYALVETLRIGTPPRRLATYYLDQGRFLPEDVTVDLLESTVSRVIASAERIVALAEFDGEPTESPGPACRWCAERDDCPSGQRFIEDDPGQI
ncbi:MAG: hypothetical protein IH940_12835 [Acidobacteria bacterium]|nr:hypothetical protein [Acidobacteriota bacterium]